MATFHSYVSLLEGKLHNYTYNIQDGAPQLYIRCYKLVYKPHEL